LTEIIVDEEKQIVPLVFQTYAVVDERTVVLVAEYAPVTNTAVARPGGFQVVTFNTLLCNKVKVVCSLVSILEKLF